MNATPRISGLQKSRCLPGSGRFAAGKRPPGCRSPSRSRSAWSPSREQHHRQVGGLPVFEKRASRHSAGRRPFRILDRGDRRACSLGDPVATFRGGGRAACYRIALGSDARALAHGDRSCLSTVFLMALETPRGPTRGNAVSCPEAIVIALVQGLAEGSSGAWGRVI